MFTYETYEMNKHAVYGKRFVIFPLFYYKW